MGLLSIIKSLLTETKLIDVTTLPSKGLFYNKDFKLKIKKADMEDIILYEHTFDRNNLLTAIECIKKVVSKNVIIEGNKYTYEDIKSVDVIFIFLEIVKFTTKKEIRVSYTNKKGEVAFVNFDINHFNYFPFLNYMKYYNEETREMIIDGYRFSLPSIGVESSLTKFLSSKTDKSDVNRLNNLSYDFMFFLGDKRIITEDEIENLIQIFNYDLDNIELLKIKNIVDMFKGVVGYSLIIDGKSVEVKTKIDLAAIWKL